MDFREPQIGYNDADPNEFLVSMELIILDMFAKQQPYKVEILNPTEYDYPVRPNLCDCRFISKERNLSSYSLCCTKPKQATSFLDTYLDNYQNGHLKSLPAGQNVSPWKTSVQKTLTALINCQQQYGDCFSISYADFDADVNFGADLILLERMKVLEIQPTEIYQSSTDFSCRVAILGNLNATLKQLNGNSAPQQQVQCSFYDLKVYKHPFAVRYQQNQVDMKENTLLAKLLSLILVAPNNQCPRTDLCSKLYTKKVKTGQIKGEQACLKDLCNTLNEKFKTVGCPYRLHQKTQGIVCWCLQKR